PVVPVDGLQPPALGGRAPVPVALDDARPGGERPVPAHPGVHGADARRPPPHRQPRGQHVTEGGADPIQPGEGDGPGPARPGVRRLRVLRRRPEGVGALAGLREALVRTREAAQRDTSGGSAYHATATGLPVRTDWHSLWQSTRASRASRPLSRSGSLPPAPPSRAAR